MSENRKIDFIRNQEECKEVGESLPIIDHRPLCRQTIDLGAQADLGLQADYGRQPTQLFFNPNFLVSGEKADNHEKQLLKILKKEVLLVKPKNKPLSQ
uniref:hypothetical protein n=2 Tax=Algoriphagus sp. TaxID=1872435 RepID=UPI004048B2BD